MNFKKSKTFWTCLVLFVIGAVSTINIIRFNFPDFSALAIFCLLIGIGFIVAGYGLWVLKRWGAILAVILCIVKLIQIGYHAYSMDSTFNTLASAPFVFVFIALLLTIYFYEWNKLE